MKSYLYAVQDEQGREVVSFTAEVEKVSEVSAEPGPGDTIRLMQHDVLLASAELPSEGKLTLYRWPADDKLSDPVAHPVSWVEEA